MKRMGVRVGNADIVIVITECGVWSHRQCVWNVTEVWVIPCVWGTMTMTEWIWVRRLAFYGGVIRGILFGAHETHPLNGGACRMGCG